MSLSEIILKKIEKDHRGKENAIKRKDLLDYIHWICDPTLTDRELRNVYCQLPVISSEAGIFWPIRKEELKEFKSYLKSKAIPLFNRYKMVAEKHKDLVLGGDFLQHELW